MKKVLILLLMGCISLTMQAQNFVSYKPVRDPRNSSQNYNPYQSQNQYQQPAQQQPQLQTVQAYYRTRDGFSGIRIKVGYVTSILGQELKVFQFLNPSTGQWMNHSASVRELGHYDGDLINYFTYTSNVPIYGTIYF